MSPLVPGRRRERWRDVDRHRPGAGAWARRLALLAALVYLALFAWTGHRVGRAEAAWLAGRHDEAHEILARAAAWLVRRGRVNDGLGVVDLARGRLEEAREHLAAARRGFFHPAAFGQERVLLSFLREGLREPARLYAAHRLAVSREPSAAFYLAVAENAAHRLDEAEKSLAAAAADPALGPRVEAQRALIAEKRKRGRADYLLDRNGTPLAGVALSSGRRTLLVPELSALLEGPWGPRLEARDLANRVRLTLDMTIQRAAEAALGPRRGSLVVIDVASGGLLAAASQPPALGGGEGPVPPALAATYEPGSIIKMITLAAALRAGVDLDSLFPLECPGWVPIDGVAFRDWTTHGKVASIDEAVAVSCNIAFGRIGAMVGRDALNAELRRFGLDFSSQDETLASAAAGDFTFRIGALLPEDTDHPNYALARRAVGLDSISITPIGAALIAAGLARAGGPPVPYLVQEKLNILAEPYGRRHPPRPDDETLEPAHAALIARTMQAVVSGTGRAQGTGRRAAVEGVSAAMKTGTSGKNPPGYEALVIGYAPAGRPVLAWALVAERAGKAELEGARITGEFLRRIEERLR